MILLDTNILVDYLRNYAPAVEFFEKLNNDILFSAITEAELLAGQANNDAKKRETLIHLLSRWTKIPVDNPLVILAGDISRKHNLDIPDAIIAASAIISNAELITRNVKDFKKVDKLRVKNPYS